MEQRPSNQEIDLLKLLAKTYNIVKRNIILVIVCPGLGLLLGLLFVQFSNRAVPSSAPVAQASLMISSDLLSESEANFLCNYLVSSDSLPGLSKKQRESLTDLSYEVRKEQARDRLLVFIKISATIKDPQVLNPLQKGILTYFNDSEPVARQRYLKEKLYKAMIEKLDKEIAGLEEIKKGINLKTPNIIFDAYSQSVNLYERRINYQNALESNNVSIVKGFNFTLTTPETSAKSKLPYLLLGFLSGIVLLAIILFLKFFSAYYKEFEKENN
jgi:hypothetical protein